MLSLSRFLGSNLCPANRGAHSLRRLEQSPAMGGTGDSTGNGDAVVVVEGVRTR